MAYSPIEQGRMLGNAALPQIGAAPRRHPGAGRPRLAVAAGRHDRDPQGDPAGTCAGKPQAPDLTLTDDDLAGLDRAFPPPKGRTPLGML